MFYKEIPPPPQLEAIVRFFWVLEGDGEVQKPLKYKLFAEGFPGLVFFFNSRYGAINGQTAKHNEFFMEGKFKMMGAYLYPYALPLLFKIPANELTDVHMPMDTSGSRELCILEEKILEAKNDVERITLLSDFLLTKLKGVTLNKNIVGAIHHTIQYGNTTVDWLARHTGLSNRQLERRFKESTGFSPKLFSRLMRFHSSLRLSQTKSFENLTDLAYTLGYCDQSHFIREFKEFSGLSPKEYFGIGKRYAADNFVQLKNQ